MNRIPKWLWLLLLVMLFGLIGGCGPESVDDEDELPWSPPETWEGGGPGGVGF